MTKEEAQKEVQALLQKARENVRQAEILMDEHRFSASFFNKEYCPRDLPDAEIENDFPIDHFWVSPGVGGVWMSSSYRC